MEKSLIIFNIFGWGKNHIYLINFDMRHALLLYDGKYTLKCQN